MKGALWLQDVPGKLSKVGNLTAVLLGSSFLVTVQFCVHLGGGLGRSNQAAGERGACQAMGVWQPWSSLAGSARTLTVTPVLS